MGCLLGVGDGLKVGAGVGPREGSRVGCLLGLGDGLGEGLGAGF